MHIVKHSGNVCNFGQTNFTALMSRSDCIRFGQLMRDRGCSRVSFREITCKSCSVKIKGPNFSVLVAKMFRANEEKHFYIHISEKDYEHAVASFNLIVFDGGAIKRKEEPWKRYAAKKENPNKTIIANLKSAIFNREKVEIAGGVFEWFELQRVVDALERPNL